MKELTLREKEDDFLKLNIGEESYLIPLASSMTLDEIRAMDDKEKALSSFRSTRAEKLRLDSTWTSSPHGRRRLTKH